MRIFLMILCLFFYVCHMITSVQAGEGSRTAYLNLIKCYPNLTHSVGDHEKGEIQIVLDPKEMATIEKETNRDVGLIHQDKYWLWINDACIFPSGKKGVYGRILWVKSLASCPAVIVMPVLPDGKIVLNCNYRHATRSWEIELPRGGIDEGEDCETAAKRETMEETGMVVSHLVLLGEIPPDTGLTNTVAPVYVAKVMEKQAAKPEDSEAIEGIITLSLHDVKQAFLRGYIEHNIRGEQKKIPFRDPFLAYAILMYQLKQLNF